MEIRALYTTKPPKCALTCLGDLAADRGRGRNLNILDVNLDLG
jgi:hypothetical protein